MLDRRGRRNRRSIIVSILALTAALAAASAEAATSLETKWQQFHANPVKVMNETPIKKAPHGRFIQYFSPADVKTRAFVLKKNSIRLGATGSPICDENGVCLKDVIAGRAPAREKASEFLDIQEFKGKTPVYKLDEMEKLGLREAALDETPWSDTYWPIYQGVLGSRYATIQFSGATTWKGYYDFISVEKDTLKSIAAGGDKTAIDTLSPSEKYDLLIGTLNEAGKTYEAGYLTPHMWEEGRQYWDAKGEVEAWMGICHGWAQAAYSFPRPTKALETTAADGKTKLKFYPSDIKGLASYIWAKSNPSQRYIGGRCNQKAPPTDKNSGRVLDEACFDTNPANWHQIVVNQIGVAKKSFIIDATFDYEVWNQPVHKYSYTYFNPQTGREAKKLSTALIPLATFTKDKFKKFRSPLAAYVVGIEMEVSYVVETSPNHNETDGPNNDETNSATYMYDLELDKDMNIVGGEWYTNLHPDFLWSTVGSARAVSLGDSHLTGTWDARKPLPKFWKDIAVQTAVRTGMPLASIVESLTATANKAE